MLVKRSEHIFASWDYSGYKIAKGGKTVIMDAFTEIIIFINFKHFKMLNHCYKSLFIVCVCILLDSWKQQKKKNVLRKQSNASFSHKDPIILTGTLLKHVFGDETPNMFGN